MPFGSDQTFHLSLLTSEGRHYKDYLTLARKAGGGAEVEKRIAVFREQEQELVEAPDTEFRFHSGPLGN